MIKSLTKTPLKDILSLHCSEIDLDLTWSTGQSWKATNKLPLFRNTFNETLWMATHNFDFTKKWPFKSETIRSIFYDPPFVIRKYATNNKMMKRFGAFSTPEEATYAHQQVLTEAMRCLKKQGKIIVKIQDFTMDHGRLYCASGIIFREAISLGFVPIDHFVQPTSGMVSGQVKRQKTARKAHVDWWVFEKSSKKTW